MDFLYSDGFYVVELSQGSFDVCVIDGAPRFIRSRDCSEPFPISIWDALCNCEGRWWEAAPFSKEP